MQKHISELVLISVLTLTASCKESGSQNVNASPSPSPKTPAEQAAEAEAEFQVFGDTDSSIRTEARQTAIAFVASKLPDWKVKGTFVSDSSRQHCLGCGRHRERWKERSFEFSGAKVFP